MLILMLTMTGNPAGGDPGNPGRHQLFANLIEFIRLNYSTYKFHNGFPLIEVYQAITVFAMQGMIHS